MRERIRNIFNSPQCELSILIIVCFMIATNLSFISYGGWNDIAMVSSILGVLVLLSLITWATVKLVTKKEVRAMSDKPRIVIESITRLLFMYWIYITAGTIFAIIWAVVILWDGIRGVKQLS